MVRFSRLSDDRDGPGRSSMQCEVTGNRVVLGWDVADTGDDIPYLSWLIAGHHFKGRPFSMAAQVQTHTIHLGYCPGLTLVRYSSLYISHGKMHEIKTWKCHTQTQSG